MHCVVVSSLLFELALTRFVGGRFPILWLSFRHTTSATCRTPIPLAAIHHFRTFSVVLANSHPSILDFRVEFSDKRSCDEPDVTNAAQTDETAAESAVLAANLQS